MIISISEPLQYTVVPASNNEMKDIIWYQQ